MVTELISQRQELQKKLLQEISDYDYRFSRYQINYSLALAYSPEMIDTESMCSRIRRSDRYIPLTDHFHAVVFDHTDDDKGIKAANKLLTYFQHTYFSTPAYSAIVSTGDYTTAASMVGKLFYLLEYAIRHRMDNHVLDRSQLID